MGNSEQGDANNLPVKLISQQTEERIRNDCLQSCGSISHLMGGELIVKFRSSPVKHRILSMIISGLSSTSLYIEVTCRAPAIFARKS